MQKTSFQVASFCLKAAIAFGATLGSASGRAEVPPDTGSGVLFQCGAEQLTTLRPEVEGYLQELGIAKSLYSVFLSPAQTGLLFQLTTPVTDTVTLDFQKRKHFALTPDYVYLSVASGRTTPVATVSKKEIALALMQHGRTTNFDKQGCSLQALKDHIGVRQLTVAWAQTLEWGWPDGGAARWNKAFWNKGTPLRHKGTVLALNDAFHQQKKYAIGCYTATKLVVVQAAVDYFTRVSPSPEQARLFQALERDGDPLVNIEPGAAWFFESDYSPKDAQRPGKLMELQGSVAPGNFVPGDWAYFLNTDTRTYQKTGYEGSNAIYLGGNRFDDYYNDNNHSYSFEEKLDEVYQWRNNVFSRSRDAAKIEHLSAARLASLTGSPSEGGLLLAHRLVPKIGYGESAAPLREVRSQE